MKFQQICRSCCLFSKGSRAGVAGRNEVAEMPAGGPLARIVVCVRTGKAWLESWASACATGSIKDSVRSTGSGTACCLGILPRHEVLLRLDGCR